MKIKNINIYILGAVMGVLIVRILVGIISWDENLVLTGLVLKDVRDNGVCYLTDEQMYDLGLKVDIGKLLKIQETPMQQLQRRAYTVPSLNEDQGVTYLTAAQKIDLGLVEPMLIYDVAGEPIKGGS